MPAGARGAIAVTFDSPGEAEAVAASLAPEMGADVPGSVASLRRDDATLTVDLEADDEGALRAAVNSYLRWMRAASEVHRVARGP